MGVVVDASGVNADDATGRAVDGDVKIVVPPMANAAGDETGTEMDHVVNGVHG